MIFSVGSRIFNLKGGSASAKKAFDMITNYLGSKGGAKIIGTGTTSGTAGPGKAGLIRCRWHRTRRNGSVPQCPAAPRRGENSIRRAR